MAQMWIADEFMKRLQEAERTGNAKELAALFTKDAELTNLTRQNTASKTTFTTASSMSLSAGASLSATQFWNYYLHAFDSVSSRFTNVIDDGKTAVLEWKSSGVLAMGLPIEYSGVSMIEYVGDGHDMKIKKFRTYYDSAAFLPHAAHSEKSHSQSVGNPSISAEASS